MPELQHLSYSEELMWESERGEGNGPPFFDCAATLLMAARVRDGLDVAALARCVSMLVERHEILRSTVTRAHDEVRLAIRPVTGEECRVVDLRDHAPSTQATMVDRMLDDELNTAIRLEGDPLFKGLVIRTANDAAVIACVVHHFAFDDSSADVFTRELATLYQSARGAAAPARPLPARRADYVAWQRAQFNDAAIETAAREMTKRLQQGGGPSIWTADSNGRQDEATRTFRVGVRETAALKQMAASERVPLSVFLFVCFAMTVRRITQVRRVLVGIPVSDRRRQEFLELIGLFVDVVVVAIDGASCDCLPDAVRHVRERLRDAYRLHRALPYSRFMRWKRDHGISVPDYWVLFSYHTAGQSSIQLPDVSVDDLGFRAGALRTQADLSVQIAPDDAELLCAVSGRGHPRVGSDITSFAGEFETVLSSLGGAGMSEGRYGGETLERS